MKCFVKLICIQNVLLSWFVYKTLSWFVYETLSWFVYETLSWFVYKTFCEVDLYTKRFVKLICIRNVLLSWFVYETFC